MSNPRVDMSFHANTYPNSELIRIALLFNDACLAEKHFYSLWFDPIGLDPMIYHARGGNTNHFTTDASTISILHYKQMYWLTGCLWKEQYRNS